MKSPAGFSAGRENRKDYEKVQDVRKLRSDGRCISQGRESL
jgi:hypothetical protein